MLALFAAVALDALFSAPTLAEAHVGALVTDAQTGRVIYARDAEGDFIPASTMKLIVGSAALDELGTAFSFVTTVATDGTSLYVRGGGDVLLGERDVEEAANSVRALGFTAFPGGIAGDLTRFRSSRYPAGWQVDDLPYDYAAPVSALSFADNVLHLTLTPSTAGAAPELSVVPQTTVVAVHDDAVTGNPGTGDTSDLRYDWSGPGSIDVVGSVPEKGQRSTLDAAMLDPAAVTLEVFARAFSQTGIDLGGDRRFVAMPPSARTLWTHRSPQLPQILASMWLPSDNLIAETLLEELGATAEPGGDTRAGGIARERTWLQSIGVDPHSLTIADGSGLSIYDRVTPRALVQILAHDWHGKNRETVLSALPVAGKSGTLKEAFTGTPLAGAVIAKTGSTMHNRTLAGYLHTPQGTVIFALMVNDWMDGGKGANRRLRDFQERFLERIQDGAAGVP
jgi:D-alanyl-D-alanine carboxypeptidase/D-alanyl-D-alanine-endopeptidase (penicillin-binding protein 4)